MKKLIEDFKKALGGLAYSDLGEMQTREQKALAVDAMPIPTALQEDAGQRALASRNRRVVLVVQERLDAAAVKYAVNTCERMAASLDILCTAGRDAADKAVSPFIQMFRDKQITHRIVVKRGSLEQAIADHTHAEPGTLLVVAGAGDQLEPAVPSRTERRRPNWRLDFPLVVVMDNS